MKPFLVALTILLEAMNRPGLRRLGRGTLIGNKEHKLQVNLELTYLKTKVKSRAKLEELLLSRLCCCQGIEYIYFEYDEYVCGYVK